MASLVAALRGAPRRCLGGRRVATLDGPVFTPQRRPFRRRFIERAAQRTGVALDSIPARHPAALPPARSRPGADPRPHRHLRSLWRLDRPPSRRPLRTPSPRPPSSPIFWPTTVSPTTAARRAQLAVGQHPGRPGATGPPGRRVDNVGLIAEPHQHTIEPAVAGHRHRRLTPSSPLDDVVHRIALDHPPRRRSEPKRHLRASRRRRTMRPGTGAVPRRLAVLTRGLEGLNGRSGTSVVSVRWSVAATYHSPRSASRTARGDLRSVNSSWDAFQ